ncbi:MAG: 50S ribosomal protein L29 [Candidatus Eisenbacteria bacterium]|uniref:Large ribosomal subunit protein uL29 n=1 Tax=Eiseniibacteriota bacterium TaxID=2212470 RepID=A0A956NGK6_UNCEI|nr:50S ribosomal protein L29 [Candidatus Eisenbacteria bacterium]MCB9463621.1 50S ribosomal protein L29 [Candidatus Eisenbacteria bacterium]
MKNKAAELRALTVAGLEERLQKLVEEQFNLRFRNSMSQLEDPTSLRTVRRSIARVKTVLNEKRAEA